MADQTVDVLSATGIEPLKVHEVKGIEPLHIVEVTGVEPLRIEYVNQIAPVAAHIKEVNHIDPLSVDAFHVTEVKGVDPLNVASFNVTHVPTLNLSVRQAPTLDMNIRSVPGISIGTHQDFDVPSDYTIRARLLGFEFLRLYLTGRSTVIPRERYRQEQSRSPNRSYVQVATAGNPGIPVRCRERQAEARWPGSPGYSPSVPPPPPPAGCGLRVGMPAMSFRMPASGPEDMPWGSSVSGGG